MNYQSHNLQQGGQMWHEFRANHFGASECAAMLGLSKYTTRSELLRQKATGIIKEVDAGTQAIFNRGHETEALARPIVEAQIGEQLSPVTCSNGKLSCSCDGITFDDSTAWEHKQWNVLLANAVALEELPEEHQPQCQQILMITGAKKLIFTVSDGTPGNMVSMEVLPDQAWFARIRAGWEQFEKDLAAYVQPEVVEQAVAAPIMKLPALFIQVEGNFNLTTNLDAFGLALKEFVAKIDLKPVDDQGFADLDAQVKCLKEAEALIKAQKLGAQGQIVSFDAMCKTADLLLEIASKARIAGENAVRSQKVAIKDKAIADAKMLFAEHVAGLEAEITPIRLAVAQPDFITATKGLKGLKSLHNEIDTALANAKIAADAAAKDIRTKLAWCKENAANMSFLFPDLQQIISKPMDDFMLLIQSRIKDHKEAEAKKAAELIAKIEAEAAAKLEAERASMQQVEEAKARAMVEAEAAAKIVTAPPAQAVQAPTGGQPQEAGAVTPRFRPTRLEMIMSVADSWDVHKSVAEIWLCDEFQHIKAAA